ncbi:prepilin peptidase [Rhodovulum kholense]|uniref:Prepilin peptidase CpaA n=1 Tax=Rhodovulum kholense TaxID=453584 RepID=A0A8E3ARB2_9RHOB|nr:prepilin peptidase [Rhodovulum kholense]PTW50776.1 prepilin peptidase CpaA [Rhodovulum kholense]
MTEALWFLPVATPIALWTALSDLRTMTIPNRAVLALVAVYALVGLAVLPLEAWAWRWLHLAVVLTLGFGLNQMGAVGAGDAKFAAAMAPLVAPGDIGAFLFLLAAAIPVAFAAHRLARRIPGLRRALPGWASWEARDFPMGFALGPALILYLALAAGGAMPSTM